MDICRYMVFVGIGLIRFYTDFPAVRTFCAELFTVLGNGLGICVDFILPDAAF